MIWLLKWLVLGHVHRWEEESREAFYSKTFEGKEGRIGNVSFCKCKSCGKPRAFRLVP